MMSGRQIPLSLEIKAPPEPKPYLQRLIESLSQDLDFHDQDSSYSSHNFHSFPAKFPPQLPRKFINNLTAPGDIVFDPIVVVGSSMMRGRDTETHNCLADIGQSLGFRIPAIGVRNLDRDRRMLPSGLKINRNSQIQQRMHEEYVIGFYKPEF
jgi:hypothetical protein